MQEQTFKRLSIMNKLFRATTTRINSTLLVSLAGLSLFSTIATADQLAPTISGNYPADPDSEKVYTFIADSSFSASTLHSYTVDSSSDSIAASGGSFLICGTNDCTADSLNEQTARTGSLSGYAEVTIFEEGPAGSGFIDPFLRQQHNEMTQNGNNTYETAYNTNNDSLQGKTDPAGPDAYDYENMAKDTNAGGPPNDFNHAVLWNEELASGETFKILLDINESQSTSEILLDEMSLWVSTSDMLSVYNPGCTYTGSAGTTGSNGCFDNAENPGEAIKVWDMDLDALVAALMLDNSNDSGKAGSGDYDVIFTFETALIQGAIDALGGDGDFYFYLENTMGLAEAVSGTGDCKVKPNEQLFNCTGGEVDAGFEEFVIVSVADNGGEVPAPASALLMLIGGLALYSRRKVRLKA